MLKSSVRTYEVFVMKMEEWAQVVVTFIKTKIKIHSFKHNNVDHSKLIKQIWALGIRDKELIYVIRQILKAPIKMPDGTLIKPSKGTP